MDEMNDYLDSRDDFKRSNLKIICTGDKQCDINSKIAALNGSK